MTLIPFGPYCKSNSMSSKYKNTYLYGVIFFFRKQPGKVTILIINIIHIYNLKTKFKKSLKYPIKVLLSPGHGGFPYQWVLSQ